MPLTVDRRGGRSQRLPLVCLLGLLLVAGVALFLPVPALASAPAAASSPPSLPSASDLLAQLAVQQAELTGSDGAASDNFGSHVALDGDTALVGVPFKTVGGFGDAGVVYVYKRTGTTWSQQAELSDPGAAASDDFGSSVALSGDTALIGAAGKTVGGLTHTGVVSVYTRTGTTWSQQAALVNPDGAAGGFSFGTSVALSAGTALIGAPYTGVGGQSYVGAAYVFTGAGADWSEQAELSDPGPAASDEFGFSVALSGDTALVGVPYKTVGGQTFDGAAYVFTRSGTNWSQQAELSDPAAAYEDQFGYSVALGGGTALVGAYDQSVGSLSEAGAAYVFTGAGASWSQRAELTAADAAAGDYFGSSVALDGGTALVGAWCKTVGGHSHAGAAYVFTGAGASWTQRAELTAADAAAGDYFGSSVTLSAGTTLVGAPDKSVGGKSTAGAAYVDVLAGSDATLKSLTVSAGTLSPGFAAGHLSYSDSVAGSVAGITITTTTSDSAASVVLKCVGTPVTNPVALKVGDNVIDIVVTAADGVTSQTYSVTVTRPSDDATLRSLTANAGTLSPSFAPATLDYSIDVENDVKSIILVPTTSDPNATYLFWVAGQQVPGIFPTFSLNEGDNVIDLVVTAQDGLTTRTYSVTVTRESSDASLQSLTVSAGDLSPGFAADTLAYTDSVAHSVSAISLTATPHESHATCALETSGGPVTDPIALNVGDNVIDVVVTAQDGTHSQTYMVTVTRESDDTLRSLSVSAGSLRPGFDPDTLNYTDRVADGVKSITVTAVPNDDHATSALEADGQAVGNPIALDEGANGIAVVVTGQDGSTQTYSIVVIRVIVPTLTLRLSGLTRGALTLGRRLTATGKVTPVSLVGDKVTLVVQRRRNGAWRAVTSWPRTISAGATYSGTYRPARTGAYRIQARMTSTPTRTAAATAWHAFKVM